ncbi:hypothetical protein CDO87_00495 [Sagittula sp. P11]|jgi:hypothetical protein|nr:hypothetical protein CDO87_00495 [Sagittula sp. P11]
MDDNRSLDRSLWTDGIDAFAPRLAGDATTLFPQMGSPMPRDAILSSPMTKTALHWTDVDMQDCHRHRPGDASLRTRGTTGHRPGAAPSYTLCPFVRSRAGAAGCTHLHQSPTGG